MLVLTPPMGWNSWNTFGSDINEKVVRDAADKIVEMGYKDVGYTYVVIDDCWSLKERDSNGRLQHDPVKFPSGMKALADYIHSKGLKFGMYSCAGTHTCAGYPASFDSEFIDAETFAEWGVDFLKYDYCYKPQHVYGPLLYSRMSMALKATGRDILFSACNWGIDGTENWIRSTGAHMYRSTGDIHDCFTSFRDIAMSQIDKLLYSGPNCFNDIDMLICGMRNKGNVGFGGCTDTEYRTHFALWCLFQSPLMIGSDLTSIDPVNAELLKNRELISIDQDPEARPPMVLNSGEVPVFFKQLANGEYVFAFFNFSDGERDSTVFMYDVGLPVTAGYGFRLRDIFTGEERPVEDTYLQMRLQPHDCCLLRGKLEKIR